MNFRTAALIAILGWVVVGCGAVDPLGPTALPSLPAIPSWEKFEGGGIEIILPDSFEGGDPLVVMERVLIKIREINPDFEEFFEGVKNDPEKFALFAIDTLKSPSGFLTNVSILRSKKTPEQNLKSIIDSLLEVLPPGVKLIERSKVDLDKYRASRVIVESSFLERTIKQVQYLLVDGDTLWHVAFSADIDDFDDLLPGFELSIRTFNVK